MRNPSHQLAALVRHLLLPTLVVWLRQDSRDGEIARINLQHCPADRVKRAQPRGRGEGLLRPYFSTSKLACVASVHQSEALTA